MEQQVRCARAGGGGEARWDLNIFSKCLLQNSKDVSVLFSGYACGDNLVFVRCVCRA